MDILDEYDLHNVAELERVLCGAHEGDGPCIDFQTQLEIMGYDHSVLAHYHILSSAWLNHHYPLMDLPTDGGRHGGNVYIPTGAPDHHHHGPPPDGGRYGGGVYVPSGAPGHHHHGPRPSRGRDGRGVPYVEDIGSEASFFPGYRAAQASGRNPGRRGGRQPSNRDNEDRYETSPPPRRGGPRRHDQDEDEIEGSESDTSAPPPRRAGGRNRRDPGPEISERRERVGARTRHDEDAVNDESPALPQQRNSGRRAGGNANVEERRARVEYTGQPGTLRFEDIQELESDEDDEQEEERPVKPKKKGGKSGGRAKDGKGKPRDRY